MGGQHRLNLTEYQPRALIPEAAASLDLPERDVVQLLQDASRRLRTTLGLEADPIAIDGGMVKASDVAGLIRVAPDLEIEVAPKFLRHADASWREDFLKIVTLSRHGQLLPHDAIVAGLGKRNDLATLIGRALTEGYRQNRRWPLRMYRQRVWQDFEIDGDIDAESVVLPEVDGFVQEKVVLDRRNQYNSVIAAAAKILVNETSDPDVQRQLQFMMAEIGPQAPPPPRLDPVERLPNRHRRWDGVVTLALAVVRGFGLNFQGVDSSAPGFVVKTWNAWEDLAHLALVTGLRRFKVLEQQPHDLGIRLPADTAVQVKPDVTVLTPSPVLTDAKYRTRLDRGRPSISSADLYESLAFLDGAEAETIVLIYPRLGDLPAVPCGETEVFETVQRKDGRTVTALMVECRGISAVGGFAQFVEGLAAGVLVASGVSAAVAA